MFHGRTHASGNSHSLVPPLIELKCPQCGGLLACAHPAYEQGFSHTQSGVWDQSAEDKGFIARCKSCTFNRDQLSYFDLPKIGELYFQTSVVTINFWAWNREHLQMLLAVLEGKRLDSNRWWEFRRFIPSAWKKPSRRVLFMRAARKMLAQHLTVPSSGTAGKRRFPVPGARRAPAAPHGKR